MKVITPPTEPVRPSLSCNQATEVSENQSSPKAATTYANMTITNKSDDNGDQAASLVSNNRNRRRGLGGFTTVQGPAKKYSVHIKEWLKTTNFSNVEQIPEDQINILRAQFSIKTHQIKRVAGSYFTKTKGAGRPEIFVKTNNYMRQWLAKFIRIHKKNPTLDEIVDEGKKLKAADYPELFSEKAWKCSKGWAKRFLTKNGLQDESDSEDEMIEEFMTQ